MWLVSRIREVADEEAQLSGSTISFMCNILPAVPVLLLGFICLEGKELVDHELSVPAVEVWNVTLNLLTLYAVVLLLRPLMSYEFSDVHSGIQTMLWILAILSTSPLPPPSPGDAHGLPVVHRHDLLPAPPRRQDDLPGGKARAQGGGAHWRGGAVRHGVCGGGQ